MGNNVKPTVPAMAEVEATRPMPEIPPNSIKDSSEIPDGSPWSKTVSKSSRSLSFNVIASQHENLMQHSESVNGRRSDFSFRRGSSSNGRDINRKDSASSRRSLVNANAIEKPEKSTQYLSKSYDDRCTKSEKSTQHLSKSYDRRLNAKIGKHAARKNWDFFLLISSDSDNEDPFRQRSRSSLADPVKTKGPMKCEQKRLEPCASGGPIHLSSNMDSEDFRHKSSLETFETTKAGQMFREKYSLIRHAEQEGSIHESQNLEKNDPAENVTSSLPIKKRALPSTKMMEAVHKIEAERRVGLFLAQHSDLKPLFEEGLRRMNKNRFVNNLRRLLKKYHLDLSKDIEKDSDRVLSQLLQGQVSRIRIARYIAHKFNSEYNEIQAQIGKQMHETRDGILNRDAWNTGNADSEFQSKAAKLEALNNIPSSDDETFIYENNGDANEYRGLLLNAVDMEEIMTRGRPFQNLSMSLEILALPATLGSLTRLLMSIPNDRIWFSAENNLSFLNRLKIFMEEHTEENWNWWPLQPRMRVLKSNQIRLHWRCVSVLRPQL